MLISGRAKLSIVVITLASVFPALLVTGFFGGNAQLSLTVAYGITVIGSAIGGILLADPEIGSWWQMMLSAVITGAGILTLAIFYTDFRDSIYKIELVLIAIVGALPGLLFYTLFVRKKNNP